MSVLTAAAQLPVPKTPPAAHSPGQRGSWDPGWPPASAQTLSPAGKRPRPLGVPTPGVAIGPEDLHKLVTKLVEAVNDNGARLETVERKTKVVGDGIGVVGRHSQGAV